MGAVVLVYGLEFGPRAKGRRERGGVMAISVLVLPVRAEPGARTKAVIVQK